MLAIPPRKLTIAVGALICAVLAAAAMPARNALSAYAWSSGGEVHAVRAPVTGLPADDSFPGAALAYLDAPAAPPRAPAATGYYDIPASLAATAPTAPLAPADLGIVAAPAIAFRGRTGTDSLHAAQCLATAIYYEAASESDDGQRAVAQVVLNRVRHPAFPNSVCGVVFQGSERTTGCQFSFTCDGAMARAPSRAGYARAMRVALDALGGRVYAPVGNATHYHTFRVWPAWGKSLVMTAAVGAHFFHRWKGFWGTPAAFRDRYAGVEPSPPVWRPREAPSALAATGLTSPLAPTPVGTAAPVAATPAPITRVADIQPHHLSSGDPLEPAPQSQILDKWKDSGTPLR